MIGVLIFPDFQLLDAAGPISVFEIAARFADGATVDPGAGGDAGTGAQHRRASRCWRADLKSASAITTLIIAGGEGVRQAATLREDARLRARDGQARRPHRQRLLRRLSSWPRPACSTAAAPPRIGSARGNFSRPIRKVKLEPDQIFVRDGNVWTLGRHHRRHRSVAGDGRGRLWRRDRAEDRAAARALSPPQRRPVAILLAAGIEGAERPVRAAAGLGARTSRRAAHGGGSRRAGRHEFAAFHPRLHRRDRHDAVEGGRAVAHRGGAAARAVFAARRSSVSRKPPAFAIPSGCAAPSSAPSASRRNRCAARRGWGKVGGSTAIS